MHLKLQWNATIRLRWCNVCFVICAGLPIFQPETIIAVDNTAGQSRTTPVSITLANGSPVVTRKAVLFAMDDGSFPNTQSMKLEMQQPEKLPDNPILPRGATSAPDSLAAESPAVVVQDGKWRMWYTTNASTDYATGRVAYAESNDGVS